MHGVNDFKASGSKVFDGNAGYFASQQRFWDDANDFAALIERRLGQSAHETDVSASVDKPDTPSRKGSSDDVGGYAVGFPPSVASGEENAEALGWRIS